MFPSSIHHYPIRFLTQRPLCLTTGIQLTLRNVHFPAAEWTPPTWTTGTASTLFISHLSVAFTHPTALNMPPDAFVKATAFQPLSGLRLTNIRTDQLRSRTFRGLPLLAELHLDNVTVAAYAPDALADLSGTLRVLGLRESAPRFLARSINHLLDASGPFIELHTLTVSDTLTGTVNATTFARLAVVQRIDLAACRLDCLPADTFDAVASRLTHLNLADNRLTRLSAELLLSFRAAPAALRIDLGGNPWHCDCGLAALQAELRTGALRIDGQLSCATPAVARLAGRPVQTADFCPDDGTTAMATAADPPSARQRQVLRNCADESYERCDVMPLRGQTKIGNLSLEAGGELHIDVSDGVRPADVVVIWFETIRTADDTNEYYESSVETATCRSSVAARFRVGPLRPDTAYTVCVVSKAEATVSPLDCLPYYNQTVAPVAHDADADADDGGAAWILEEDKWTVIGCVAAGAVVSLLLGVAVSFALVRKHPAWLPGRQSGSGPRQQQRGSSAAGSHSGAMAGNSRTRYSDVSLISDGMGDQQHPAKMSATCRTGPASAPHRGDLENKYYLDYLPVHKEPPPLPPPNGAVPVLYGLARSLADGGHLVENYYSQVGVKNRV